MGFCHRLEQRWSNEWVHQFVTNNGLAGETREVVRCAIILDLPKMVSLRHVSRSVLHVRLSQYLSRGVILIAYNVP